MMDAATKMLCLNGFQKHEVTFTRASASMPAAQLVFFTDLIAHLNAQQSKNILGDVGRVYV